MRQLHELIPGSPEWHEHRLTHFNASEASAMLGLSPHVTRNELLRMKHTGNPREFSEWFQKKVLDNGHATEAAARPIIEARIGDDLYPAVYSDGKLSVSCDGLTMDGKTAWEHKQWNEALAESVVKGVLPDDQQPQVQQNMMVTGAERLFFTVSDGTPDKELTLQVTPDPEWCRRILQGWVQFALDLANYQPPTDAPAAVAAPIEALPALVVQVEGKVLSTNLNAFKARALDFIGKIKTELSTDQDFADAEQMVKFLGDGEDQLETAKAAALAQTASIDELFRAIDHIKGEMRAKRLALDRTVKSRKDSIRTEIENGGKAALAAHIAKLNERIGKPYMPSVPADFAGSMRGKKTISSLRNAVDTELARAKIAASEAADRIEINLNSLRDLAGVHKFLFADAAQLVLKDHDAVVAIIKQRIAEHDDQERKRREVEVAKAAEQAPPPAPTPAQVVHAAAPPAVAQTIATQEPANEEIVVALANLYGIPRQTAIKWIIRIAEAELNMVAPQKHKTAGKRK